MRVSSLQIKVHQLFLHTSSLRGNTLIKQQLVLNFRDGTPFDSRGMGNNGIQIELFVVYLFRNPQRLILIECVKQLLFLFRDHHSCFLAAKVLFFLIFFPLNRT